MNILFTLVAVIPFVADAQDSKKNNAGNRIAIGFSFSPDYNNRTLKNNDGSSSSDHVINARNENEQGRISFTTGLYLNTKLSEKLEFQTGLLYSNKGYKIPKRVAVFPVQPSGAPTHFRSKACFNYFEIPLKLNFITGKGKTKFIAGAGLVTNFLLNESDVITFYYVDGSEKNFDQSSGFDYKKFNLSSVISAGVEFKLKENITLRAEPTFRYGLLKIIDEPVSARLWNVGLNLGVYMQLRKRE